MPTANIRFSAMAGHFSLGQTFCGPQQKAADVIANKKQQGALFRSSDCWTLINALWKAPTFIFPCHFNFVFLPYLKAMGYFTQNMFLRTNANIIKHFPHYLIILYKYYFFIPKWFCIIAKELKRGIWHRKRIQGIWF